MKSNLRSKFIRDLDRKLSTKAFLISRSISECYNRFPKHEANILCTNAIWKMFLKYELMIPWNVIVLDDNTTLNDKHYVIDNHHIEIVFMFRISQKEIIQCSLDAWTPELLIEYKKLIKGNWEILEDNYSNNLAAIHIESVSDIRSDKLDYLNMPMSHKLMWQ